DPGLNSLPGGFLAVPMAIAALPHIPINQRMPFLVVTTEDKNDLTKGLTSLREATIVANTLANAPGRQWIVFARGLNGKTISLDEQLTLAKNIDIAGPGSSNLTISRNAAKGNFRLVRVLSGSDSIISGLTLTNGNAGVANGGAILNAGTLAVNNCVI